MRRTSASVRSCCSSGVIGALLPLRAGTTWPPCSRWASCWPSRSTSCRPGSTSATSSRRWRSPRRSPRWTEPAWPRTSRLSLGFALSLLRVLVLTTSFRLYPELDALLTSDLMVWVIGLTLIGSALTLIRLTLTGAGDPA